MNRSAISALVGAALGVTGTMALTPATDVEVGGLATVKTFSEVYAFDGSWHPLQLPDSTIVTESFIKTAQKNGRTYALAFWPLDLADLTLHPTHAIEITNRNDPTWPTDRWVSYQPLNLDPLQPQHIWTISRITPDSLEVLRAWITLGECATDTSRVEYRVLDGWR